MPRKCLEPRDLSRDERALTRMRVPQLAGRAEIARNTKLDRVSRVPFPGYTRPSSVERPPWRRSQRRECRSPRVRTPPRELSSRWIETERGTFRSERNFTHTNTFLVSVSVDRVSLENYFLIWRGLETLCGYLFKFLAVPIVGDFCEVSCRHLEPL